jgi:predicted alpha/beta hydrolase family esterase
VTAPTVLILPGYDDSGPGHWQSLWERAHPAYVRVPQRSWTEPVCEEWVSALDAALVAAPSPAVLVAHSLGCLTVAHHALRYSRPIKGALLVAPPNADDPTFPPIIKGFRPIPRQPLPFPSILVAASDDWYMAPDDARALANAWGSRFVLLENAGHINADAGFGPWPEGERLLAELTASPRAC